jgi:hypothetical protein
MNETISAILKKQSRLIVRPSRKKRRRLLGTAKFREETSKKQRGRSAAALSHYGAFLLGASKIFLRCNMVTAEFGPQ